MFIFYVIIMSDACIIISFDDFFIPGISFLYIVIYLCHKSNFNLDSFQIVGQLNGYVSQTN